jgi:hypothetical protein
MERVRTFVKGLVVQTPDEKTALSRSFKHNPLFDKNLVFDIAAFLCVCGSETHARVCVEGPLSAFVALKHADAKCIWDTCLKSPPLLIRIF